MRIVLALISILSNISLFASNRDATPILLPWLIIYLILISILFWLFYKALKTKKKKYRYMIIFIFILMIILAFIPI